MQLLGTKTTAGSKSCALRWTRWALLGVALFASLGCDDIGDATGLGIKLKIEQKKLSNGLTVILAEDHTVPVISYQTWFRVGSVDEELGITGISHLFEHLMFKGTEKYGPKEFFNQLEAKGAEVNAFTTRDYTAYYQNFIPTLLEKVVVMESDRLQNLRLNEQVLQGERAVVFEERRLRTDNQPEGKINEALWGLAYQAHPYRWPVVGFPQDLASITLEQLQAYFKKHYQPGNAVVVVVGDFDTKKLMALMNQYYGPIPGRGQPKRQVPKEPEQKGERRMTLYDEVSSDRLAQAYRITSASEDDSYALDVLVQILFGGTSARAYQSLVEQADIALGVVGTAFTPTYPGLLLINTTMKQGVAAAEAEARLEKLIETVQTGGVTADEIRVAVKQLTVQLVDGARTPQGLGNMIGTVMSILGSLEHFASDLAKYTRVTEADVKRVAQKYLIPNHRSVVIMSPKRTAEKPVPTHAKGAAQ